MPQTGTDLVGAGYPISRPLTALLGGNTNVTSPNVPAATNLDFGLGNLTDVSGATGSATSGSVYSVAVPVTPGTVITKVSWVTGASAVACPSAVTNFWSALYTGTGSAPGTTGAQPTLIGQTASLSGASIPGNSLVTFTFSNPVTITSVHAFYGFVYASYSLTFGGASPNLTGPSLISMTAACAVENPWYSTSPYSLYMTSNGGTASSVPATIGTATRVANPPIVILT